MATYKEIKGVTVQTRDEDPVIGGVAGGSWSSGGDLNTARKASMGFGILTANIVAGGDNPAGGTTYDIVEQYNGTSWTEITDLNTGRRSGKGVGSTTAGLIVAGVGTPPSRYAKETESWNGSAWTEVGDLTRPTSTQSFGSAGASNTSAMIFGGEPGTTYYVYTETWDGSSWTEVNNLNTGRQSPAGFGIVTAAICAGGYSPPAPPGNVVASNESWDGTNWTEVNDLNTARGQQGGSGAFTDGLIYGGSSPPGRNAQTEAWDGTSYTEVSDMATARSEFGYAPDGASPQSSQAAIAAGGNTPGGNVATTEEWTTAGPTSTILTEGDLFLSGGTTLKGFGKAAGIPSGSWGSAGNLNTARGDGMYGFGTTSAAGIAGGDDGTPGDSWVGNTEIYNGSSWSEQADLNTARYFAIGSGGTTTAAIGVAGRAGPSNLGNVESWNGSAWTETTDINTTRRGVLSTQPPAAQTQIVVYSGYTTTQLANTESWDGSTWTELSDLNSARYTGGDGGSGPGDAICAGGQPNSPGKICEFWDGTSWSEGADLNTIRIEGAASGATSTSVIYGGGNNPGGTGLDTVEYYNGSSWTEIADLADGGNGASHHIGSAHDTFFAGGISPTTPNAASASTEHFTADNTLADITVS